MSERPTSLQAAGGRWQVAGALSMDTVAAILGTSAALDFPQDGVVDLAAVDRVDSSGVALLLAWTRRAATDDRTLTFVGMPDSLRSLATLYGVEELLAA